METIYNLNKLQERSISINNSHSMTLIYNGILNEDYFGLTTSTTGYFPIQSRRIVIYYGQDEIEFDVVSITNNKLVLRRVNNGE